MHWPRVFTPKLQNRFDDCGIARVSPYSFQGIGFRNWKKRWFVLKGAELVCYKDGGLIETVGLRGCTIRRGKVWFVLNPSGLDRRFPRSKPKVFERRMQASVVIPVSCTFPTALSQIVAGVEIPDH